MHYWFKSYGYFAEWVDLAYWWSFNGEGSSSAACAAGLFLQRKFQNRLSSHEANQSNLCSQTEQIKLTHHCHQKPRCEVHLQKYNLVILADIFVPRCPWNTWLSGRDQSILQRISGRDYLASGYLAETDLSGRD